MVATHCEDNGPEGTVQSICVDGGKVVQVTLEGEAEAD